MPVTHQLTQLTLILDIHTGEHIETFLIIPTVELPSHHPVNVSVVVHADIQRQRVHYVTIQSAVFDLL